MNYKTMLMASAAVLFASQAMAQDLTGAFSVPGKGQILSDTTISMSRAKWKETFWGDEYRGANDGRYAAEFIEYGITDNFSINAGIENEFDTEGRFNNDHNFDYTVGAKYNTRFDDVLFQVAGRYETYNPKDFLGKHNTDDRWQKSLGLDLKAGLDLGNGITPYIVYSIESDIDVAHRTLDQDVSLGIHKYTGKWALDGAVRYSWGKNNKTPKNYTETWFDAEADYYLKDNVALGLYGSYLIDARERRNDWSPETKDRKLSDYEIGLHVKVLF